MAGISTMTPLEVRLLAACVEARVWMAGHGGTERQMALLDAAIAEASAEPIPVGEAHDSSFGEFIEAGRSL